MAGKRGKKRTAAQKKAANKKARERRKIAKASRQSSGTRAAKKRATKTAIAATHAVAKAARVTHKRPAAKRAKKRAKGFIRRVAEASPAGYHNVHRVSAYNVPRGERRVNPSQKLKDAAGCVAGGLAVSASILGTQYIASKLPVTTNKFAIVGGCFGLAMVVGGGLALLGAPGAGSVAAASFGSMGLTAAIAPSFNQKAPTPVADPNVTQMRAPVQGVLTMAEAIERERIQGITQLHQRLENQSALAAYG